jgi:hypothetical protein
MGVKQRRDEFGLGLDGLVGHVQGVGRRVVWAVGQNTAPKLEERVFASEGTANQQAQVHFAIAATAQLVCFTKCTISSWWQEICVAAQWQEPEFFSSKKLPNL